NDVVSDMVGDQLSRRHDLLNLSSKRRVEGSHLSEHVAGRDLWNAETFLQKSRLRSLSRARSSDQYNDLTHLNRDDAETGDAATRRSLAPRHRVSFHRV